MSSLFQQTWQKRVGDLWGAIPRVSWVRLEADEETLVPGETMRVRVRVAVDAHTVSSDLFQDRVVRPKDAWEEFVDMSSIEVRENPVRTYQVGFSRCLKVLRGLIREADPRIGLSFVNDAGARLLPRGELFDPPRMRWPEWENPGLDTVPCALCDGRFNQQGMPAMWAGGNLLWVHGDCWIDAHVPL